MCSWSQHLTSTTQAGLARKAVGKKNKVLFLFAEIIILLFFKGDVERDYAEYREFSSSLALGLVKGMLSLLLGSYKIHIFFSYAKI
jgi:hypothetical protein